MPESFLQDTCSIFPGSHISAALIERVDLKEDEIDSDTYLNFLSLDEKQRYSEFTFAKRKTEYLTGRISAKLALAKFLAGEDSIQPQDIHIRNAATGRPYIVLPPSSRTFSIPDISISHSKRYGCSLAANTYCGIDIQEPQETLLRVYEKFCHTEEEQTLRQSGSIKSTIARLTLLWAAKEAVRKACGHTFIPGFLELSLIGMEKNSESYSLIFSHRSGESTVACRFLDDYGLAISLSKEKFNA